MSVARPPAPSRAIFVRQPRPEQAAGGWKLRPRANKVKHCTALHRVASHRERKGLSSERRREVRKWIEPTRELLSA